MMARAVQTQRKVLLESKKPGKDASLPGYFFEPRFATSPRPNKPYNSTGA